MTSHVVFEKSGPVARVTLNRPAVLNAMDQLMHTELAAIWDEVEADDDVRVVVLTGAGDRSFSVGQDLRERERLNRSGSAATSFGSQGQPGHPRLTDRFTLTKPIVARVNGYALGGGFELALACDIVVAVDTAEFALPEVTLGLVPGAGGGFRLARQLPLKVAMGYLLTGRRLSADTALKYGLVNDVVPAAGLDACVEGWAADLAKAAPLSVRALKESVYRSLDLPLPDAFTAEYEWEARRRRSHDAGEGVRAFTEKRAPRWQGR